MHENELHKRLIAAARQRTPDDRVPGFFESRVMARLRAKSPIDAASLWSVALWRATAPCVAIMLLLSAWAWFGTGNLPEGDLSQDLENTVLAVADADTWAESLE